MVKLTLGKRKVPLPFTARIYDVTPERFEELADEETKAELFDGVMVVEYPGQPWFYPIYSLLYHLMRFFAEKKELGTVLGPDWRVRLSDARRLMPDAFFLAKEQLPDSFSRELSVVPKLVIEISNPWDHDTHRGEKRFAYQI